MADDDPIPVNLDLNLGLLDNTNGNNEPALVSYPTVIMNLEDWFHDPARRVREVSRQRNQRLRRSLWRQLPIPLETQSIARESAGEAPTGEGSVIPEQRIQEVAAKVCENDTKHLKDEDRNKSKDNGKSNIDGGSYFDCNICLDLAKEPVVTCCGHLFCWPCLYRWLHHHSDAKECPVCKGEVEAKSVTPIYGRGSNNNTREPHLHSMKIPLRPQVHRVESLRQAFQRTPSFTVPVEEMIRRLGSSFDLPRELAQSQPYNSESPAITTHSVLNRLLLTSGGVQSDTNPIITAGDIFDLMSETRPPNLEARETSNNLRISSRANPHQASNPSNLAASAMNLSAERSHFDGDRRNLDLMTLPVVFDDRDSVSSIAAVIHSEGQTVDNAVEIDSTVARSTLSSRRRNNDASRISDVDSGDSRAIRRRRLN